MRCALISEGAATFQELNAFIVAEQENGGNFAK